MSTREITKELAGQEDIMFGQGSVSQTRQSGSVTVTKIQVAAYVETRADLKLLDVTDSDNYFKVCIMAGQAAIGDANWGIFWHDPTEPKASADDTTIIIDNNAGSDGCWKRLP